MRIQKHLKQWREAVGKQSHLLVVALALVAHGRTDDVVGHHGDDVALVHPRALGKVFGTQQALLLGGDVHEHQGGGETVRRKGTGHRQHGG